MHSGLSGPSLHFAYHFVNVETATVEWEVGSQPGYWRVFFFKSSLHSTPFSNRNCPFQTEKELMLYLSFLGPVAKSRLGRGDF